MRRQKHRGLAAALIALAALLYLGWAVAGRQVPLTIEVIAPGGDAEASNVLEEDAPTVLIYHTHTWEAYEMTEDARYTPTETWRTKDNAHNMIRVGQALGDALTARGFVVTHDKTAFEPPNLSAAYTRSLAMLEARQAAGETYDYILDVHRDAYSEGSGGNTVSRGEAEAARVMLLVGKGTGTTGSGFDVRPDWPQNLELAQAVTDAMNTVLAGVAREVRIKTGRFNQHVSTAALLIEVGNNRNTLEEALSACDVIAEALFTVHAQGAAIQD